MTRRERAKRPGVSPPHPVGSSPPADLTESPGRPDTNAGPNLDADPASGPDPEVLDAAALAALARARRAAADRGLRPGVVPRRRRKASQATYSQAGQDERDPVLIGDQFEHLLGERGWQVDIAAGSVMGRWAHIVGPGVAAHSQPVGFQDGILTVRAESTAWATQLRYMTSQLIQRIETEIGPGTITELKIVGPTAPSWRHGPRRSLGPGPRDTYG